MGMISDKALGRRSGVVTTVPTLGTGKGHACDRSPQSLLPDTLGPASKHRLHTPSVKKLRNIRKLGTRFGRRLRSKM